MAKVKNSFERLPEAVDGASSLAYFAVDSWTVLIAEKDRCVSLPCSYNQQAKHMRFNEKSTFRGTLYKELLRLKTKQKKKTNRAPLGRSY